MTRPHLDHQLPVRQAVFLAGLGTLADMAAVAQLVTTGSRLGVLVAGLLSMLVGFLGLFRLAGRPIGPHAVVMAVVIAVGAGTTGAMIDRFWTATPAQVGVGTTAPTGTVPATTDPEFTPTKPPVTTAPPSTTAAAPTGPAPGTVLRQAVASLRDQDYLDVETGRIGEVTNDSDLWYIGSYRELWTAFGGKYPITRIGGTPDRRACAAELSVRDYDLVEIGDMPKGSWACAYTAEKNLVAIQVREVPSNGTPLVIGYTVWQE